MIAAIDGSFASASTKAGNGSSGFLINVDTAQRSYLNASVFGLGGSSGFRIALESSISGVAGGSESYLAVPGAPIAISAIPEPEIFAMLLSGLGLIGYVAHRRKRSGGHAGNAGFPPRSGSSTCKALHI